MPWYNELSIWYGHTSGYDYNNYIELCVKLDESEIDIIALSGINRSSCEQNDLNIPGYCMLNSFKSTQGVCMYIKEYIPYYQEIRDGILDITLKDGTLLLVGFFGSNTKILETYTNMPTIIMSAHNVVSVPHNWKKWKLYNAENGIVIFGPRSTPKGLTGLSGLGGSDFFEILVDCEHTEKDVQRNKGHTVHEFGQLPNLKLARLNRTWSRRFPSINVEGCLNIIYVEMMKVLGNVPSSETPPGSYAPDWVTEDIKSNILSNQINYKLLSEDIFTERTSYEKDLDIVDNETHPPIKVLIEDERKVFDRKTIAQMFNTYFVSVHKIEDVIPDSISTSFKIIVPAICISEDEVFEQLETIKKVAPGPDRFRAENIRIFAEDLKAPVTHIFNKSLQDADIPEIWKLARVTPKHKKDEATNVKNYRPISITSSICKMLEKILTARIDEVFVQQNIISKYQHGYKNKRSATTNLLQELYYCTRMLDKRHSADVIYLDLSKAYDTVPHRKLLKMLESCGLNQVLLDFITCFLSNREQFVAINGSKSDKRSVVSGIPQGSVLSNVLFAIFMNEIPYMIKSKVSMYCDDIKIYSKVDKVGNSYLQDDLLVLNAWFTMMEMSFNKSKCKVMHLGSINPERDYYFLDGDMEKCFLEKTEIQKDLGVYVDKGLTFKYHIEDKVKEGKKRITHLSKKYLQITPETFTNYYKQYIMGIFEHASTVWSPNEQKYSDMLEEVQKMATDMVLELAHLSYSERLEELNLYTLKYRRYRADLILFYNFFHDSYNLRYKFKLSNNPTQHSKAVVLPTHYLPVRERFFFHRGILNWNQLPEQLIQAQNVEEFTELLEAMSSYEMKYCYNFG